MKRPTGSWAPLLCHRAMDDGQQLVVVEGARKHKHKTSKHKKHKRDKDRDGMKRLRRDPAAGSESPAESGEILAIVDTQVADVDVNGDTDTLVGDRAGQGPGDAAEPKPERWVLWSAQHALGWLMRPFASMQICACSRHLQLTLHVPLQ